MKEIAREEMQLEEKASSKEQLLKYAGDVGRLYEEERAHRKALEETNEALQREILERTRLRDELRRSEHAYRSLFEESQEAIYVTSRGGILLDANNAFLNLVGHEREEIIGASILAVYADHSARPVFQGLIEKNDGVKDYEFRLRKKDGTVCECMLTASVRRNSYGSVIGYQGIVRDVTLQRRTQQTLELARRMEALAHMAGGIAHEIRNPLAISSSAAQLLQNTRLPSDLVDECVEKVLSGINRASVIIENLLVFAKPMTDYSFAQVNLVEIVTETIREFSLKATNQNLEVVPELSTEDLFLRGNSDLLHRAFLNLFFNGLSAMPQGGALRVSVERQGLDALVRIADCGKGMTPEHCVKIFDPFFKDFPATGGVGLGLSVAFSVVRHHGGTIQVESELEKGSTFVVTLPLESG